MALAIANAPARIPDRIYELRQRLPFHSSTLEKVSIMLISPLPQELVDSLMNVLKGKEQQPRPSPVGFITIFFHVDSRTVSFSKVYQDYYEMVEEQHDANVSGKPFLFLTVVSNREAANALASWIKSISTSESERNDLCSEISIRLDKLAKDLVDKSK